MNSLLHLFFGAQRHVSVVDEAVRVATRPISVGAVRRPLCLRRRVQPIIPLGTEPARHRLWPVARQQHVKLVEATERVVGREVREAAHHVVGEEERHLQRLGVAIARIVPVKVAAAHHVVAPVRLQQFSCKTLVTESIRRH